VRAEACTCARAASVTARSAQRRAVHSRLPASTHRSVRACVPVRRGPGVRGVACKAGSGWMPCAHAGTTRRNGSPPSRRSTTRESHTSQPRRTPTPARTSAHNRAQSHTIAHNRRHTCTPTHNRTRTHTRTPTRTPRAHALSGSTRQSIRLPLPPMQQHPRTAALPSTRQYSLVPDSTPSDAAVLT
jgi:hypothetical protein